jgi:hypothetical protein
MPPARRPGIRRRLAPVTDPDPGRQDVDRRKAQGNKGSDRMGGGEKMPAWPPRKNCAEVPDNSGVGPSAAGGEGNLEGLLSAEQTQPVIFQ